MPSRREFLTAGAAGLVLLGERRDLLASVAAARPPEPSRRALSILILGGTSFIGPHQVAYALARGHSVTTFTRGRTVPTVHRELFTQVESLTGDRANDLESLRGRGWDAVIDNSGQRTAWTRDSANLLKDSVELYLYTSSTGVYYPYLTADIDESTAPVLEMPEGVDGERSVEYGYGVMKATSELEARKAFGDDRTIVVRPTYMMGPADTTDRFPYWPERLSRGGEIMVPGHADDPVQYIDVRDVASWMIRLIEDRRAGTFNAVGPASATGMRRFVHGAHAAFSSKADFVAVDDYAFLKEQRVYAVVPWIMPVDENFGSARVDNSRGIRNGLTFRPLAESIRDIHEWWYSDGVTDERRQRLVSGDRSFLAREAAILSAWKARG